MITKQRCEITVITKSDVDEITPVIRSYHAHFAHGNAYRLEKRLLQDFVLRRE